MINGSDKFLIPRYLKIKILLCSHFWIKAERMEWNGKGRKWKEKRWQSIVTSCIIFLPLSLSTNPLLFFYSMAWSIAIHISSGANLMELMKININYIQKLHTIFAKENDLPLVHVLRHFILIKIKTVMLTTRIELAATDSSHKAITKELYPFLCSMFWCACSIIGIKKNYGFRYGIRNDRF